MQRTSWFLIAMLLIGPAAAQVDPVLPTGLPGTETPDLGKTGSKGYGDATGNAQQGAGKAAGGLNGTIAGQPIGAGASTAFDVDATYETRWTFDLPLRQGNFSLRALDGSHRDAINVTVEWTSGNVTKPLPGNATLEMRGPQTLTFLPTLQENSTASFTVPADGLYRGAETAWRPALRITGAHNYWSAYDDDGTALAVPATSNARAGPSGDPIFAHDRDRDGRPDDIDNCPQTANPDQANMDGDIDGDACDTDIDGDGYSNKAESEAPSDHLDASKTPDDRDGDGFNNTAETDARADPDNAQSTPMDPDADSFSTAVELEAGSDPHNGLSTPHDPDADGLRNEIDNCPMVANRSQSDDDADGIGNACDTRPDDGPVGDEDGDGIINQDDNCRRHVNPDQGNIDGDRLGDVCDADMDGDGHVNWDDAFRMDGREWLDSDNDGLGNNADEDDDNDGISDTGEASLGTDPTKADTDGDRISDLDELTGGTDALDAHDPPYLPERATAIGNDDGSVTITWDSSGDDRVIQYVIWDRADRRVVGKISAGTGDQSITDNAFSGANTMYAIQAVFLAEEFRFNPDKSASALLFKQDQLAWQAEAGSEMSEGEKADEPPIVPVGEKVPTVHWMLVLTGLLGFARRRRVA